MREYTLIGEITIDRPAPPRGPSLHDLRGMVRAARKRHRRAHRECAARAVRDQYTNRLVIQPRSADAKRVDAALLEVHQRVKRLHRAEFDRFTRQGFTTKERA